MRYFDTLICLSKTRLSSWYIAPFLDNRLLDLSWVGSGTTANFFWDINTFFNWFEERYQFGDVFTDSLGFQVTGFFWNFLDDGFFSVEAFFFSGNLGGSKLQVSSGTSWMTVSFLSKHSSSPGTWVVPAPQISRGTFLHSVSGLYFFTFSLLALHFCTGHLVHFCSVV